MNSVRQLNRRRELTQFARGCKTTRCRLSLLSNRRYGTLFIEPTQVAADYQSNQDAHYRDIRRRNFRKKAEAFDCPLSANQSAGNAGNAKLQLHGFDYIPLFIDQAKLGVRFPVEFTEREFTEGP